METIFDQYEYYHRFDEPIEFDGFICVGYFAYSIARINNNSVNPPRSLFADIENKLIYKRFPIADNKTVFIFKDLKHFGTENFALQFSDLHCRLGHWEDVTGRGGKLSLKP